MADIELKAISYTYPNGTKALLEATLAVEPGEAQQGICSIGIGVTDRL